MNHKIEDNSPLDNFDYYDSILIRIIKKYYPDLSEKEMRLAVCLCGTMNDFRSDVVDAREVEARMTINQLWLEYIDFLKPSYKKIQNRFLPTEYKDFLSNLISNNIIREEWLFTPCGSAPGDLIKYEQFLTFVNEDMTNEILVNSEALEDAAEVFRELERPQVLLLVCRID